MAGPGFTICITPPQLHMHLHVLFTAGFPPTNTVGEPGAQGAAVTGTHGCGVRTPIAAAVAAATCGFAMDDIDHRLIVRDACRRHVTALDLTCRKYIQYRWRHSETAHELRSRCHDDRHVRPPFFLAGFL